jgi:hypothetical protein
MMTPVRDFFWLCCATRDRASQWKLARTQSYPVHRGALGAARLMFIVHKIFNWVLSVKPYNKAIKSYNRQSKYTIGTVYAHYVSTPLKNIDWEENICTSKVQTLHTISTTSQTIIFPQLLITILILWLAFVHHWYHKYSCKSFQSVQHKRIKRYRYNV